MKAFLRVLVAVQPNTREAGQHRVRVEQPEDDQVVPTAGALEEGPGIVVDHRHARVGIWLLGVDATPQRQDRRIDLDCVDTSSPGPQRGRDVVAGSGPYHEHRGWLA